MAASFVATIGEPLRAPQRTKQRRISPCALRSRSLLSCCFITASAIAEVPQTVDKHYAIQGRAELEAQIGSGSIHTRSCGGCRDIHVHLEMNGVDRSRYHLEEQQSGNHVRFVLKQDDYHGWNWTSHNGKSPELTVEVPQESSLELGTGSGDVTLRGVRGSVNMHTGSGDITIDETSGALSLRTGSGGLSGKDLSGTMKAPVRQRRHPPCWRLLPA